MKVAIVGSRSYPRESDVVEFVEKLAKKYPDATVVSGGARGPDSWAVREAKRLGLTTAVFPADWTRNGRRAGYIRNVQIVDASDRVVAFWDGTSSGTRHTVTIARDHLKPVYVYGPHMPA